jgi:hypothetical protein
MIRYTRGSRVVVETIFYDSSGDIAQPSSVEITFTYRPCCADDRGWTLQRWQMGPCSSVETLSDSMTNTGDGTWAAAFYSDVAATGLVHWRAVADTLDVNTGRFELRGGRANRDAVPCADVGFNILTEDGDELQAEDGSFLRIE